MRIDRCIPKGRRTARIIPVFALLLATACWPGEETSIDIGSRKQLFIDHRFIESSEGIKLVMNPPYRTGEELIVPDQPWERGGLIGSYSSVVKEERSSGSVVKIWYQVLNGERKPTENPPFMVVDYAESTDGIHFRKPSLGLVELNGSKQNNIVLPPDLSQMRIGGGSIGIDLNPRCPPGERYKSWCKIYPNKNSGIHGSNRVWYSPDGLQWRMYDQLPTGLRAADTQPSWFWDLRAGRYFGYSREWVQFAGEGLIRMASRNESDDMLHWEKMQIAFDPDERDFTGYSRPIFALDQFHLEKETWTPNAPAQQIKTTLADGEDKVPIPGSPSDIYGPGVFPYLDAEDVYIALIPFFHHWRMMGKLSWPDTFDVQLATSRDGLHFQRPDRRPFLGLGMEGSFDSKMIWPLPTPIRMGDELWIYYRGGNADHSLRLDPKASHSTAAISRAVMRLDGFVSADSDYEGGAIITPSIRFSGRKLELNLNTSGRGEALVEILDNSGNPIPGYTFAEADPINGNSVRMPVAWRRSSDVSSLAGKAIKLHFRTRGVKLYAFQFR